ncbi:MarC family protein [Bernardetia sp. ABR2-2B]|uniref:MarC family protein n=1 Tax=Bernardetia sp. ABR2-2B TaxID=3127472 RepID=UPI0030CB95E5
MDFNFKEIVSVSLILFSVIDILGSIPIIIDLRKKNGGELQALQATIVSGILMVAFLFLGQEILQLFGLDVASFAIAGGLIMFFIGLEMVLGIDFFKSDPEVSNSTVVPLAFPLIAGAGTMTTLISLRAEYSQQSVLIGIVINLVVVYLVLRASKWIDKRLGATGKAVLRKVFGIILLAIAIKLIKTNIVIGIV